MIDNFSAIFPKSYGIFQASMSGSSNSSSSSSSSNDSSAEIPKKPIWRLPRDWLAGGLANALTSGFLNPLDVVKTRMQANLKVNSASATSFRLTLRELFYEGGFVGLWRPGLVASCTREMISSGARAGLYTPVRDFYDKKFNVNDEKGNVFLCKVAAALTTGTAGAIISNPVDLVKIRLMANPTRYNGLGDALSSIIKAEGYNGLLKGIVPSTLRGASIAVGELAAYDHTKTTIKSLNLDYINKEGTSLHILSSLVTGVVATTMAAPFDLIKTRAMNSVDKLSVGRIFKDVVSKEGPLTFFRGWVPSYCRLGPHALICFPIFEQLRILFGLGYI